jgi:hypothetical protein
MRKKRCNVGEGQEEDPGTCTVDFVNKNRDYTRM